MALAGRRTAEIIVFLKTYWDFSSLFSSGYQSPSVSFLVFRFGLLSCLYDIMQSECNARCILEIAFFMQINKQIDLGWTGEVKHKPHIIPNHLESPSYNDCSYSNYIQNAIFTFVSFLQPFIHKIDQNTWSNLFLNICKIIKYKFEAV